MNNIISTPKLLRKSIGISWNLTYRCNLDCIYCSGAEYRNKKFVEHYYLGKKEIRYGDMKNFFNMLENDRRYIFKLMFSPNNGESLLHPDFLDVWNRLSEINSVISMKLVSNGTIIYKMLPKLDTSKLKELVVSVDSGIEDVNDILRGKGTFKKAITAIKNIMEIKKNDTKFLLHINVVVNKINVDSLYTLPKLFEELKGNININLVPVATWTGNARKNREKLNVKFSNIMEGISNLYKDIVKINNFRELRNLTPITLNLEGFTTYQVITLLNYIKHFKSKYLKFSYDGGISSCGVVARTNISIDPYGNILPCGAFYVPFPQILVDFMKRYKLNQIPHISQNYHEIDDIFNTPFFQHAREWVMIKYKKLKCAKCPLQKSCTVCPLFATYGGMPHECEKL